MPKFNCSMFHLPKFEKDPNVQYVHILISPSVFECHSSHSKPAPLREVPREKKIQVRPNDKDFSDRQNIGICQIEKLESWKLKGKEPSSPGNAFRS